MLADAFKSVCCYFMGIKGMEIILKGLGALSLLYYIVIWLYTGRKKSTFSIFWLVFGGSSIALGHLLPHVPPVIQQVVALVAVICLCIFVVVEFLICKAMFGKTDKELAYLIVLGAQVRGIRITNSLQRRLDAAVIYLGENPMTQVVVSGGQGKGEEISEALAMRRYLEMCGIKKDRIQMEDRSKTTMQNLRFSKELLGDGKQKIGIVTNNFHLYRALTIGRSLGYESLQGIAASSNAILFINYIIREFFGVIYFIIGGKSVDK